MKQKELDEPSLSMMSYASDEGGTEDKHQTDSQNYNDMDYDKMSVQYSPVKSTPMTMKNNCVNLRMNLFNINRLYGQCAEIVDFKGEV